MSACEALDACHASPSVPSSQVHREGASEAPRVGRRRADAPRDTIDIAFKSSQYPTPCTDHTVAGDRPGHRERHLGRDYAPNPLTRSHMNNALVVPFAEGVSAPGGGETGTASLGPSALYVLNSKNNGKRHFDERRGVESPWVPARRYVPPPGTEEAAQANSTRAAVHRRGRGVYNLACGDGVHPDAVDALARRRVKGEAAFRGGLGKAMVEKPPDHSVLDLGLAHTVRDEPKPQAVTHTSASHAAEAATSDTAQIPLNTAAGASSPPQMHTAPVQTENATCYVNNGFVFSSAYVDESQTIASVPYVGSMRPHQDVPEYLQARQARSQWQAARHARGAASKLSDDVHAVRQLPDW